VAWVYVRDGPHVTVPTLKESLITQWTHLFFIYYRKYGTDPSCRPSVISSQY